MNSSVLNHCLKVRKNESQIGCGSQAACLVASQTLV